MDNELVVQIMGKSEHEITEFYVEAEIHDFKRRDQIVVTLTRALEAVEQFQPKWPASVQASVKKKTNARIGNWTVKFTDDNMTVIYQHDLKWEHND